MPRSRGAADGAAEQTGRSGDPHGLPAGRFLCGVSGIPLLVSAGSIVAAMNWHSIWRSTALVGAQQCVSQY